MSDTRSYLPAVADDLPAGERPMIAVLHALVGHVAHFFAALAEHSTADASALTQLVEVR